MGRWVSKRFVEEGHEVYILDNLSNSTEEAVVEFRDKLANFVVGDILDRQLLANIFEDGLDLCVHLAASVNVQRSIDDPESCFRINGDGTFNVLEECRKYNTKLVFISSALIYQAAQNGKPIFD